MLGKGLLCTIYFEVFFHIIVLELCLPNYSDVLAQLKALCLHCRMSLALPGTVCFLFYASPCDLIADMHIMHVIQERYYVARFSNNIHTRYQMRW